MYLAASTLWHEWQHLNYGVGARRETVVGSRNYNRTYGKEIQLANAVLNHLNSETGIPFLKEKITDVTAIRWAAMNP